MDTNLGEEMAHYNGAIQSKSAPVVRLSALDRVFDATGEVTVRCGTRQITLPIQSVDQEMIDALVRDLEPKPKTMSSLENGRRVLVIDQTHEPYRRALEEFQRTRSIVFVLCGLACDVESKQKTVVWSADNSTRDLAGARQALKDMGMVDNQLLAIMRAINDLTTLVDEQQVSD